MSVEEAKARLRRVSRQAPLSLASSALELGRRYPRRALLLTLAAGVLTGAVLRTRDGSRRTG